MEEVKLCPYCNSPIVAKGAKVTCGAKKCRNKRAVEMTHKKGKVKRAGEVDQCRVCKKDYVKNRGNQHLCGDKKCRSTYDAMIKKENREAVDPMTELRNRFLQLPVGFR